MAAPIGNFQLELEKAMNLHLSEYDIQFITFAKQESEIVKYFKKLSLCEIDWITSYFDNCERLHSKSADLAAGYRVEGNRHFQKKMYTEAVDKYTLAVVHAPPSTEQLALAYGNRSAALFRLKLYDECLADIEAAIRSGFPLANVHKLMLRKAHCLDELGNSEELTSCLHHVSRLTTDTTIDSPRKDELEQEIEKLKEKNMGRSSKSKMDIYLPTVSYDNNPVLTQASSCVALQYSEEKGRYLTTIQDIKAGDTLIVERPYAGVLLPDHYTTHCHHCYGKLKTQYPCRKCTFVRYCCNECSLASWQQYHSYECCYLQLLHSIGIAHLSLRIVIVAGLDFLLEFRTTIKNGNKENMVSGMDKNGQYCRNYQAVYDLLTHLKHMTPSDVFQYTMTSQLLLKILKHSRWFEQTCHRNTHQLHVTQEVCQGDSCDMCTCWKNEQTDSYSKCVESMRQNVTDKTHVCETSFRDRECMNDKRMSECQLRTTDDGAAADEDDDEDYIGGLLLRHILQLVCNAHAITELQCNETDPGSFIEEKSQVRIATAIYPTASLMNHSCDPTIISSRETLVVRAVKDVSAGGEIFNCYGPHHKRMGYSDRQRCLREQYFFVCECQPCKYGGKAELAITSYKCQECSGPACHDSLAEKYVCEDCGSHVTVDTDQVGHADSLFVTALQYLQDNKFMDAVSKLKECLTIRQKYLYKFNKHLAETHDCLARCRASLGQFKKSAKYLQKSIDITEHIYGERSIELANELHKLSEVLISAQDWKQALSTNQKATHLFELHYGKSHDIVRELTSARKELLDVIKALKL